VRSLNLFFFSFSNDFSIYAFRARSGSLKIGLAELKVAQKMASWFYFIVRNLSLFLLSLMIFPFMLLGSDPENFARQAQSLSENGFLVSFFSQKN
jgi:hypothetical protein